MTETSTWLADRALIRVAGPEARDFLQGLLTQDVVAVRPGSPRWAGLMTPQGKALFDFVLWDDERDGGQALLIDCEADQADALVRRLALYRLRRPVTIERVAGGVHWSRDPARGVPDPRLAELGNRWLGDGDGEDASAAWRANRLSRGVTEGIAELGSGETLWLEANARELNGVSFAKGCYVGQENTARMHHRAKVNRRLVVAPIGDAGARTRIRYPELGMMVELRRIDALDDAIVADWMRAALID
ncbi:YgfZ/GcvT domain-containing protein [Sphingomonas japonica]|uniref:Aminomethyltransferase folate-binding domain-containing protein n=1 Tax=Sphingomonas japonica TaxID=511662 RepID=A0ABX0U353_9SPHN|nr:folate-binding protein YgfZ [Sphingomonas japonica]NIJ23742.1 hypothetical protein [Sphingomonas japonica]